MASSMTGFGSSSHQDDQVSLSIQVKSVNGRFLETKFRLPKVYGSLESQLRHLITEKLSRGTVDIFIHRYPGPKAQGGKVVVNTGVAQELLKTGKELTKKLKISGSLSLGEILKFPGVVEVSEETDISPSEKKILIKTFSEALNDCSRERNREGQALEKALSDLLSQLEKHLSVIKKEVDKLRTKIKENLETKLRKIGEQFELDETRLAQEALYLTEKADIEEEIVRAQTHIENYRKILGTKESAGKKLEFYTQELHREFNTIGSKATSLDVVVDVIEAKGVIERLREQVQNIE